MSSCSRINKNVSLKRCVLRAATKLLRVLLLFLTPESTEDFVLMRLVATHGETKSLKLLVIREKYSSGGINFNGYVTDYRDFHRTLAVY